MTRSRQVKGLTGDRRPAHLRVMDADKLAAATARLAPGQSPTQIATALGVLTDMQFAHDGVSDHADVAFHVMRVLAS